MTDERPSDAEPEPAVLGDGSLAPTSTANGSGTSEPGDAPVPAHLRPGADSTNDPDERTDSSDDPDARPDGRDPDEHTDPAAEQDGQPNDRLVQGNRVTTQEDME